MKGQTEAMEILYNSTRGNDISVRASQAILKGLSEDGGLFVPDHIPALEKTLKELSEMDYRQVAYEVMRLFLTDYTEEELKDCIERAYDVKFDTEEIVPLKKRGRHTIWSCSTAPPSLSRIWRCPSYPI